ncbi:MAG: hypothetical protein ACYTX0_44355, partial [Nostoc sp.]
YQCNPVLILTVRVFNPKVVKGTFPDISPLTLTYVGQDYRITVGSGVSPHLGATKLYDLPLTTHAFVLISA